MKSLVKWLLVPSVVLLGMAFVASSSADAGWRVRRYYGYRYAPRAYYAPVAPGVHVRAPGVHVRVAPPVVRARPYYYGPPAVVAPPRIITPWFQMW